MSAGTGDGGGRRTLARAGATGPGAGFKRSLSLLGVVALCVGNMVGTSIWTLPASLAEKVGPLGLVSWVVTAAGYLLVAVVYASIGTRYPRTGGPYGFAREAFGEFAGFSTMWAYWLSAVIGNAAREKRDVPAKNAGSKHQHGQTPNRCRSMLGAVRRTVLCWLNKES